MVPASDRQEAESRQLVAYYTLTGENSSSVGPIAPEALRAHMATTLPEYMVPSAYVLLQQIPVTDNGKRDRGSLPAPDHDAYAQRVCEAPRGDIEKMLAALWTEILGVERIGRNDNFFELGGQSILATS